MYSLIAFTLLASSAFLGEGAVPSTKGIPTADFKNRFRSIGAPHIIGGSDISIEKVPFQVSLQTFRFHTCGGAIISENYVLTAAHCGSFRFAYNTTLPNLISRIRVGSPISIPLFGWGGSIHNIDWQMSHPKWNPQILDYDIAIIKVSNPFSWSPRIQPARIPQLGSTEESFLRYDQNATVTGWGITKENAWFTPWYLKAAEIKLLPREECEKKLSVLDDELTSRMLCGGGNGKGGPCNGDSGGPLLHREHLIGISSFVTQACNDPEYPAGFANILDSEIRLFIKQIANV